MLDHGLSGACGHQACLRDSGLWAEKAGASCGDGGCCADVQGWPGMVCLHALCCGVAGAWGCWNAWLQNGGQELLCCEPACAAPCPLSWLPRGCVACAGKGLCCGLMAPAGL